MAVTIPLRALLPYALGALDYLLRNLLPSAPTTSPISAPYIPPFTGGQCSGVYYDVSFTRTTGTGISTRFIGGSGTGNWVYGAVSGIEIETPVPNGSRIMQLVIIARNGERRVMSMSSGNNAYDPNNPSTIYSFSDIVFELLTYPNQIDNCGNVPNNTPSRSTSDSGLADSGSPNLENNPIVQAGIPILVIPSFMSALLAALNAAKSASDALAAVRAIAEAIEAIADLLNALKDKADKDKKKDDPNNKEITRNDFGSIRFDGYLRLYPSTGTNEREAIYIDLQLLSIPVWYGKYFGRSSPNFYRFKSLGYISFTSPTFGIIETKEIEFSRMSLNVPASASGFFYHLGLEGDIIGNISAFYQKSK